MTQRSIVLAGTVVPSSVLIAGSLDPRQSVHGVRMDPSHDHTGGAIIYALLHVCRRVCTVASIPRSVWCIVAVLLHVCILKATYW